MKTFKHCTSLLVLGFTLAGCVTAKMDIPSAAPLPVITGAPTIAISVKDARSTDSIGKISATTVKVLRTDFEKLTAGLFKEHVYGKRFNTTPVSGANLSSAEGIQKALTEVKADALLHISVQSLRVKSVDMLLDEPSYNLDGNIVLYDNTGKLIYQGLLTSSAESRNLSEKDEGETMAQLVKMAILEMENDSRFSKALSQIKS